MPTLDAEKIRGWNEDSGLFTGDSLRAGPAGGVRWALNTHLHSIAWSMDLKDLGLPFRKFWMLWRASIALPAGEEVTCVIVKVSTTRRAPHFLSSNRPTFHDVYRHQAHHGWEKRVAGRVHCDGPAHTMANEDDGRGGVAVASLNHIGDITEGGGAERDAGSF